MYFKLKLLSKRSLMTHVWLLRQFVAVRSHFKTANNNCFHNEMISNTYNMSTFVHNVTKYRVAFKVQDHKVIKMANMYKSHLITGLSIKITCKRISKWGSEIPIGQGSIWYPTLVHSQTHRAGGHLRPVGPFWLAH